MAFSQTKSQDSGLEVSDPEHSGSGESFSAGWSLSGRRS